jgi:hypothetical protein
MGKKAWAVFQVRRVKQKGSAFTSSPEFQDVLQFDLGFHTSRDDAVRSLVVMFYPELHDSNTTHIKRVSKEFLRGTMGNYKIMKAYPGTV